VPEITLNGPIIRKGRKNVILRDAVLHCPNSLPHSTTDYNVVKIGIREGSYTEWVGTWDQSTQSIDAAVATSILNSDRLGMRLKENQAIVIYVSETGGPATLAGSRVNFRMAEVGGHYDAAGPLVSGSGRIVDVETRSAVKAIERNINGRLSEWEESVQLRDVTQKVVRGTFQARLQLDSATQISLQRYAGNWIEVDGKAVDVGSSGFAVTTTDGILTSAGGVSSTAPSTSTLYYVYVNETQIRLCATGPSLVAGVYYLGSTPLQKTWRYCGAAYVDGSKNFNDSNAARDLANYYNRLRKPLFTCPDYVDDNIATTYTENTAIWTKANAGVGSDVTFVANGEDAVYLEIHLRGTLSVAGQYGCAVSIDGVADIDGAAESNVLSANERDHLSCSRLYNPTTAGFHTASLCIVVSAGNLTVWADDTRRGAAADPAQTYMTGHIMA